MPLKEHIGELNSILMELYDIVVKIEDGDLAMILLASLPLSYENFVSSLSIENDSITLEEVKSSLYSKELRLKAFGNGDEVFVSELSMTDSARGQKKKKDQGGKKIKVDPNDIYSYYKEPGHWKIDCTKKETIVV